MKVNDSVNQPLTAFAIAAAVIMLATCVLNSPAQAEIVYHSADIVINDGTYNLDLNGDGLTDFTIASTRAGGGGFLDKWWSTALSETPAAGNGAIVGPLGRGNEIGPAQVFDASQANMSELSGWKDCKIEGPCRTGHSLSGPWLGKTGYLGLSFQVNGETYYGWAYLRVGEGTGTLLGYAYETIPGRAIKAGQTSYLWFTSTTLNFGLNPVGTNVSRSEVVTNLGPTTLTISNATLTGVNATDFSSQNSNPPCGGSIAEGATCKLTFSFRPSISGKETAMYSLFENGGTSPQQLRLVGTGQ